jgi:hypothetical protein
MFMHRLKSYLTAQSGVAAIEFAIILPVMLILYFGMFDLTGLISNNRKLTTVAAALADLTGQNRTTVLKSQIDDYMNVGDMIIDPMPTDGVTLRVYGYRIQSGAPTKIWSSGNGSGPGCSGEPSTAGFTDLMSAGNDLVVAQACLTYEPFIGTLLGKNLIGATSFNLQQEVVVRPRSTLTLKCEVTSGGATCS